MKKYFFGLAAFVVAVASVAFTTAPNTLDRTFRFDGTEATLSTPANWVEITSPVGTCEESDETVCTVKVQDMTLAQFKSQIVPNLTQHSDLDSYSQVVEKITRDE